MASKGFSAPLSPPCPEMMVLSLLITDPGFPLWDMCLILFTMSTNDWRGRSEGEQKLIKNYDCNFMHTAETFADTRGEGNIYKSTNLVFNRQDTVSMLCELSHGQDAVVGRGDDIILCRRIDGGNNSTHLRELLLQQAQHSGPQARACTWNSRSMHLLSAVTWFIQCHVNQKPGYIISVEGNRNLIFTSQYCPEKPHFLGMCTYKWVFVKVTHSCSTVSLDALKFTHKIRKQHCESLICFTPTSERSPITKERFAGVAGAEI